MTLIAGFKTAEGFVLCADSQEKVTIDGFEYRVTRQKLEARNCGHFSVAIAGSGANGTVIDACAEWLYQKIAATSLTEIVALKEFVQHELREFDKAHKSLYAKKERQMALMIGAVTKAQPYDFMMWTSQATLLKEVSTYALIGYSDQRYEYAMQNMYGPDLTIAQAIFLGIYVILLAEKTCNTVMRPVSAAVVKAGDIAIENQAKVDRLTTRVQLFAAQFDQMFLACPDTGLQNNAFAARMEEFVKTIAHLRMEYVAEWVGHAIDTGLDKIAESWNLVPVGATVVTVPITPEVDKSLRDMHERTQTQLRATAPHLQEKARVVSNLTTLRHCLDCDRNGVHEEPSDDPLKNLGNVLNELSQAAMMGPVHLSQTEHLMLARALEVMIVRPEEMQNQKLHLATVDLRVAVIDQALAVIQMEAEGCPPATPSDSQTSEGR